EDGHLHGDPGALEHRLGEEVVEDEAPVERVVRQDHVGEHRPEHSDDRGGYPTTGVADWDRLDGVVRRACVVCRARRTLAWVGGHETAGFTSAFVTAPPSTPHFFRMSA